MRHGEAGWSVLIASSAYEAERESEAIENLLSHRVGGLVLTVADADQSATLDGLDREGVPYVLVYNQPDRTDRASATIDNVARRARCHPCADRRRPYQAGHGRRPLRRVRPLQAALPPALAWPWPRPASARLRSSNWASTRPRSMPKSSSC